MNPQEPPKENNLEEEARVGKKTIEFCGEPFSIDQHYQISKLIGKGTYGVVAKGINKITGQEVAIKKMSKLFLDLKDAKRILREIRILKFLKNKNIIELIDIMTVEDEESFNQVYLVFEFMTSNLAHVIKHVKLSDVQVRVLIYRLLSGLYYMHSANIIHRDLKPENLLVNKKCQLKIGDLNLATKCQEEDSSNTEYVSTRWYRAPEVLLCCSNYNNSIDIWSAGCILAQLVGKDPLFRGQDYLDQFFRIAALLGIPTEGDFDFEKDSPAAQNLNSLLNKIKKGEQWSGIRWSEFFKQIDPLCADLLDHMLVYNPRKRYTVQQCLRHPYLKEIYEKFPPEKCEQTIDWSFDNVECSEAEMRSMFIKEIGEFRSDLKRKESLKREAEGDLPKPLGEEPKKIKKQSSFSTENEKQKQKQKPKDE